VTCEDVDAVPSSAEANSKPVIAVAAMGETPMSPVMEDGATVEMPALARIVKLPAVPRSTVGGSSADSWRY